MKIFVIQKGAHKGKKITVQYYLLTNHGVEIKISHDVTGKARQSLRWVQTIFENGTVAKRCGRSNFVDPWYPTKKTDPKTGKKICKGDDKKPFYYTDQYRKGTWGKFYDSPQDRAPKKGRFWYRFTTSLTNAAGKDVKILVSVYWGYDRYPGGRIKKMPVRKATPAEQVKHLRVLRQTYPSYTFSPVK